MALPPLHLEMFSIRWNENGKLIFHNTDNRDTWNDDCNNEAFSPERIKQNFQIFDFVISDEDMKALDGIRNNMRYLTLGFLERTAQLSLSR
ncbi:unnamed protein product [Ranitomeya imitator]|uniref:Uncharacterized protein n=1 Tax=Ranitomeya imitator TaxID=111125 RepID=A0ABN9M6Q0_9NEOB|nr:unnamed protein product [Ranitomeya imitator]